MRGRVISDFTHDRTHSHKRRVNETAVGMNFDYGDKGKTPTPPRSGFVQHPLRGCQPSDHDANHGQVDHGLTVLCSVFIVFAQPATMSEPGKCALNHPSAGKEVKAFDTLWSLDDLKNPVAGSFYPLDQLPRISPSAQMSWRRLNRSPALSSRILAPSLSWILAACTITINTNPIVSTRM